MAVQRIGRNDAAVEAQQIQHFQCTRGFVAAWGFALCQRHAGLHRKDVDQLQWRRFSAAFVGPAHGLAIDRHHSREIEPLAFANAAMKRRNTASNEFGLSRRKTRLKVSWLGIPCSKRRTSRSNPSLEYPNSSMSEHDTAPQSTAASATKRISSRSCLAFSARGSGKDRKAFLNWRIRLPPRFGSRLQNPLSDTMQ
jgi:hypothetical protein